MKIKLLVLFVLVGTVVLAQSKKSEWTVLTPSFTYEGGTFSPKGSSVPTSSQLVVLGFKKFAFGVESGPLSFYDNGVRSEAKRTVFDAQPKEGTSAISGGMTENVSAIYADEKGTLWFAATKGLFSMSKEVYASLPDGLDNLAGKHGVHYKDVPVKNITSITGDNTGKIWVASASGLASFDGTSWKQFTVPQEFSGLRAIVASGANIYAVNGQKVIKFDGTTFSNLNAPSGASCIKVDSHGVLYCGTGDGAYTFADGKWSPILTGLYSVVTTIDTDDHSVWVGTTSNGVYEIFPNGTVARIETKNSPIPSDGILKIVVDNTNTKWFFTDAGVAAYKEPVVNAARVEVISQYTSGYPYQFVEDAVYANNRWNFATSDAGLVSFDGKTFKRWTPSAEINNNGIAADKNGKIYMATSKYLSTLSGEAFEKWELKDQEGISKNINDVLVDDKGQIWLAHNKGVSKYDGSAWQHFDKKTGLTSNSVTQLFQDGKQNIWIISNDGLSKYNGTAWENHTKKTAGVGLGNLKGIAERDGKIYTSNGWALIQYDGTTFTEDPAFKRIDGGINHFAIDDAGNFWFASEERGLIKFAGGVFTYINTDDGIPNNCISHVFFHDGAVWASSGHKQQREVSFGSSSMGSTSTTNTAPPKPSEKEIFEGKLKAFGQQYGLIRVK